MGANAAGEQLDQTIVLVNLVPLKQNFDPQTAFSIYEKFWKKQVFINKSRFGAYEVVYVRYPGYSHFSIAFFYKFEELRNREILIMLRMIVNL